MIPISSLRTAIPTDTVLLIRKIEMISNNAMIAMETKNGMIQHHMVQAD